MPINSLILKNVASYDATGVRLNDIKKLNFFIGYNGTGKSTIAKYLRDLSLPIEEKDVKYNECSCTGYIPSQEIILVYDEQFRMDNFIESDKLKGVFSLDKQNAKIDNEITFLENKIKDLERENGLLQHRQSKCEETEQQITGRIIDKCFAERNTFKFFVKAPLKYGNNKQRNFHQIQEVLQNSSLSKISYSEIQHEYKQLFEQDLQNISLYIDKEILDKLNHIERQLNKYLTKVVVGSDNVDIADLINRLNMSGWVSQGRDYLKRSSNICPFCQQPIVNKQSLTQKLEAFFNENYKHDIDLIKEIGNEYYKTINELKNTINKIKQYSVISKECNNLLLDISEMMQNNLKIIQNKLLRPNEIFSLLSLETLDSQFTLINDYIRQNNQRVEDLDRLKLKWHQKCWEYMAIELQKEILSYKKKNSFINNRLKPEYKLHTEKIIKRIEFYRTKIQKLCTQTINTNKAVNNINKILNNIGFTDFKIEEISSTRSSSQYQLKRTRTTMSENVYLSLSEGEKTFISFLYFYQLCLGTDAMAHRALKKIIVIDDPISSLDSQILFVVSSLVHKLDLQDESKRSFKDTNISQIFIMTHNLYFYKEISLDRRPFCKDCMHFRVYKPIGGSTGIESSKNSFPTDDYSLLWKSLKAINSTSGMDENRNIMICNVMRRIIDSYVNFIGLLRSGGNPTWKAISSLDLNDPIYIVASSFISQINDESHSISPFDNLYYNRVIRQDTTILFKAFKLIFDEIGPEHYNMMMK